MEPKSLKYGISAVVIFFLIGYFVVPYATQLLPGDEPYYVLLTLLCTIVIICTWVLLDEIRSLKESFNHNNATDKLHL